MAHSWRIPRVQQLKNLRGAGKNYKVLKRWRIMILIKRILTLSLSLGSQSSWSSIQMPTSLQGQEGDQEETDWVIEAPNPSNAWAPSNLSITYRQNPNKLRNQSLLRTFRSPKWLIYLSRNRHKWLKKSKKRLKSSWLSQSRKTLKTPYCSCKWCYNLRKLISNNSSSS